MTLQRYDINEEMYGDANPAYNEPMWKLPDGEFVRHEDVRQLINAVYDRHRDTGSQEFDAGVIDVIADLMDSIGLNTDIELKR